ncbi:putative HTH-type transcriptional regulator [Pandoraea iniqua]|uniref:Putative HTH-type transcriptional regulator n=1 Tax=Pandoraea iniqua TaxID=2508288 RepID=A0A5E4V8H1_9BURK|nr:LexA family transcriptional regulator [Pandoraea iniqua]VVE08488.1 putative HTH-type transcriptional regulator [Pandoraea iniqua]VVE34375.1 putative HTH-type transcriptional regulator [Pandoraea iniqua]
MTKAEKVQKAEIDETAAVASAHETDDDFIGRLRLLVARAGNASALVRQAGISASGFQKYLNGAEPSRRVLIALSQAGSVTLEWLMTGRGPMEGAVRDVWPENHLTLLPLYRGGEPDCPVPEASPEKLVQLAFCQEWLARHGYDPVHLATMRVEGNAMSPTFRAGDTLVVDRQVANVADGEVYVLRDGSDLLIKRLQRQLGGMVSLTSDNAQYAPIQAPLERLDIVGRVIWRGALL